MSALDRYMYGNPETILMNRQQREINCREGSERVCTGCVHKRVIWLGGVEHKACSIKRGSPTIFCNFHQEEKA